MKILLWVKLPVRSFCQWDLRAHWFLAALANLLAEEKGPPPYMEFKWVETHEYKENDVVVSCAAKVEGSLLTPAHASSQVRHDLDNEYLPSASHKR